MKGIAIGIIVLTASFFLGNFAWAQRSVGFSGRPAGPGFSGSPVGPGFGGRPVGPGFSPSGSRIGFQGVPRGPGFEPNRTGIGFQGDPNNFPVADPNAAVQFEPFGSNF